MASPIKAPSWRDSWRSALRNGFDRRANTRFIAPTRARRLARRARRSAGRERGGNRAWRRRRRRRAPGDERGEVCFMLRGSGKTALLEYHGNPAVEIRGGELDRMARDHAQVEAGEPAALLDRGVIADAVALRSRKVPSVICTSRPRSTPAGTPREDRAGAQAPGRKRHRVAGALDLRERGEQLGRHERRRVLAEDRLVLPPGFRRRLGQRAVTGKKSSAGLRTT